MIKRNIKSNSPLPAPGSGAMVKMRWPASRSIASGGASSMREGKRSPTTSSIGMRKSAAVERSACAWRRERVEESEREKSEVREREKERERSRMGRGAAGVARHSRSTVSSCPTKPVAFATRRLCSSMRSVRTFLASFFCPVPFASPRTTLRCAWIRRRSSARLRRPRPLVVDDASDSVAVAALTQLASL